MFGYVLLAIAEKLAQQVQCDTSSKLPLSCKYKFNGAKMYPHALQLQVYMVKHHRALLITSTGKSTSSPLHLSSLLTTLKHTLVYKILEQNSYFECR